MTSTISDICKLGDLACSGKLAKLGEKKRLFRQKKPTLSKIAGPGPTSEGSFRVAFQVKMKAV